MPFCPFEDCHPHTHSDIPFPMVFNRNFHSLFPLNSRKTLIIHTTPRRHICEFPPRKIHPQKRRFFHTLAAIHHTAYLPEFSSFTFSFHKFTIPTATTSNQLYYLKLKNSIHLLVCSDILLS